MVSLRRLLLREGLGIVAMTAVAVTATGWWGARTLVRAHAEQRAESGLMDVQQRLLASFEEAMRCGEGLSQLWLSGLLPQPGGLDCERRLLVELQSRPRLCNLTLVTKDGSASAANVPETEKPGLWLTRGTVGAPMEGRSILRRWTPEGAEQQSIMPDPAAPPDWMARPWVRQALAQPRGSWTQAYPFLGTVGYGTTYTIPVRNGPKLLGVVGVDLLLGDLKAWVHRIRPTAGAQLALLDERGRMLVSPVDPGESAGRAVDPRPLDPERHPLLWRVRQLEPGAGWSRRYVTGQGYLIHRLVVDRPGVPSWELLAAIPESDLQTTSRLVALLAGSLGLLSTALLSWRLNQAGRRIAEPLEALAHASHDLASGRLLLTPTSSIQEVEDLSGTLQKASLALNEQAALQEQLKISQQREWAGAMAAGIAHDLGNLLGAVGMQLELAREEHDSRHLESATQALRRSVGFIRALLSVGRPQEIRLALLDLNDPIRGAATLLSPVLGNHIALHLALSEQPLWIQGDALQLEQVLLNLSMNARDAMRSGGILTVATGGGPEGHWLKVTDTGEGMSAEVKARLFLPFFTTKTSRTGSGLGLAMVKGIADAHRAEIQVQSEPGHGTTFTLLFPVPEP